jgi:hypothetical protein
MTSGKPYQGEVALRNGLHQFHGVAGAREVDLFYFMDLANNLVISLDEGRK